MLDCPGCSSILVLTAPTCACGADVRAALEGVGLVCETCDAWNPVGRAVCEACGGELAVNVGPAATPTATSPPIATPTATSQQEQEQAERSGLAPFAARTDALAGRSEVPPGPPVLQRTGRARTAPLPAASSAPAALRVSVVRVNGRVSSARLGAGAVLCGRSEGDLVVPGDTVSRHHARFTVANGRAVVEDLGSLNGTWIRLRAPRALGFGDELRLGDRRLRLGWTPAGAALEEVEPGGACTAIHPLRARETSIGRAGDVRLDHLDPLHARIEPTADGHAITDLGSRTGTWFRLVAPEPVEAGDELLLGAERVRIDSDG